MLRHFIFGSAALLAALSLTPGCSSDDSTGTQQRGGGSDAGTEGEGGAPQRDAAVDPQCAATTDGVFASTPPCPAFHRLVLDGRNRFICTCQNPCPCNFLCKSFKLPEGGELDKVCVPK